MGPAVFLLHKCLPEQAWILGRALANDAVMYVCMSRVALSAFVLAVND